MGKVLSIITRPIKNFNIENRAHKLIGKEKLKPAPKYKATVEEIDRIKAEYPEAEKKIHAKNPELETRLKDVFVTSYDPEPIRYDTTGKSSKILPLSREQVEDFEYGFKEPEIIPSGRVTLRQALKFISDHEENPNVNSSESISKTYNINKDTTDNILKYFRMYKIHIPEIRKNANLFATPTDPDKKLLESNKEKST